MSKNNKHNTSTTNIELGRVYIKNKENSYILTKIITPGTKEIVVQTPDQKKLTVNVKDTLPGCELGFNGVDDMIHVSNLHEATILDNLRIRFKADRIYTYTGSILLVVNPYRNIPLYTDSIMQLYENKPLGAYPPHIFGIADVCYRTMNSDNSNQSIVISGESGSGKTVSAKLLLQYLARVSAKANLEKKKSTIQKDSVLAASPILEAFGNAKTIRNDNSSRFGKLTNVQFEESGFLIGAKIQTYLLEKTRVTYQNKDERNFHVFYYVTAGADKTERDHWQMGTAKQYAYTNQSGCIDIKSINSKHAYVGLKRSLSTGGFTAPDQHQIFSLIAVVLHIGNIHFIQKPGKTEELMIRNPDVVRWVSYLLEVEEEQLSNALLYRKNFIRGEEFTVPLNTDGAYDARDALARQLYDRQFNFIVNKLNLTTDKKNFFHSISLLDIYGFEVFERNSYEQLLINYANERLQYQFNEHIFKQEQQEYKNENISIKDFTYEDNQNTINLFDKKPLGILLLIDEECRFPQSTDESLLTKMLNTHKANKKIESSRISKTSFLIHHYAGPVTYDSLSFIEKNRETFSRELVLVLGSSNNTYFKGLFEDLQKDLLEHKVDYHTRKKETQSAQYRTSLIELMSFLSQTDRHYVRCIKPNSIQAPTHFTSNEVLHQLRYSGVLETIRIRQSGFPNRRPLEEFVSRYTILVPKNCFQEKDDVRTKINKIMKQLEFDEALYCLGKTKIFLKDVGFHRIEGLRNNFYNKATSTIQATYRGYRQRCHYLRLHSASLIIQAHFKNYLKSMDCSSEVTGAMKNINLESNVKILEKLAQREKNVETIFKQGGVNNIISAMGNSNNAIRQSATKALGRMAITKNSAVSIARSGAVKKALKQADSTLGSEDALQLIDHLSAVDKGMETVVREGGIKHLTNIITSEKHSEDQGMKAACALATLAKNARSSRIIGRDHDSIKSIIESMRSKPKFSRLIAYSINCLGNLAQIKHNLDSVVSLGSIDTVVAAMRYHKDNARVYAEGSKTLQAISQKQDYINKIVEAGTVELCLRFVLKHPDECAEVLDLLQILLKNDPNMTNVDRFVKTGGIQVLIRGMKKTNVDNIHSGLMKTMEVVSRAPLYANSLAAEGAGKVVVDSLKIHPEISNVVQYGCDVLYRVAKVDEDTQNFIKSEGAVQVVANALEHHVNSPNVLDSGAATLSLFADHDDLQDALHVVGKSKIDEGNAPEDKLKATQQAIAIIANLALLEDNVPFIIREGAIPILLSVISGTSSQAQFDPEHEKLLASATRAVGRVLITQDIIDEFGREGGFPSILSLLETHIDQQVILESLIPALNKLFDDPESWKTMIDSGILKAILAAVRAHPEFHTFVINVLGLLTKAVERNEAYAQNIITARGIEAGVACLSSNNPRVVSVAANFLTSLSYDLDSSCKIGAASAEALISALQTHPEDVDTCTSILKCLMKLAYSPRNVIYLVQFGAAEAIVSVLEKNSEKDEGLSLLATRVMGMFAGKAELEAALKDLDQLTQKLKNNPKNEELLEEMQLCVGLLNNMVGTDENLKVIIDSDGLRILGSCLDVVSNCPISLAQESLMESLITTFGHLAQKPEFATMICNKNIKQIINIAKNHLDYETFCERLQEVLLQLASNNKNIKPLIELNTVELMNDLVNSHPLSDKMLVNGTHYWALLSNDVENAKKVIKRGKGFVFLSAVKNLLGTDSPLVDALLATGRVCKMAKDSGFAIPEMQAYTSVLIDSQSHVQILAAAAHAFAGMSADKKFNIAAANGELAKVLIRFLTENKSSENFCEHALEAIAEFSEIDKNNATLNTLNVLDTTVEVMETYPACHNLQLHGLRILTNMSKADKGIATRLGTKNVIRHVIETTTVFPDSLDMITQVLYFIETLSVEPDNIPLLLKEGTLGILEWAKEAYPDKEFITTHCNPLLELLKSYKSPEAESDTDDEEPPPPPETVVESGFDTLEGSTYNITQLKGATGVIGDIDREPQMIIRALKVLSHQKLTQEQTQELIMEDVIANLVTCMNTNRNQSEIVESTCDALANFVTEEEDDIEEIVTQGGVGALLKALKANMHNPGVLLSGITLLGNLATNDHLKTLIGLQHGIPLLNDVTIRYRDRPQLLEKCAIALGHLAFNNPPNVSAIVTAGAVPHLIAAMMAHPSHIGLLEFCTKALSNVAYNNNPNKGLIGRSGGPQVLADMLQRHPTQIKLFTVGVKALASLAIFSENIPIIVKAETTKAVVMGMYQHSRDAEFLQSCMTVLKNLSAGSPRVVKDVVNQGAIKAVIIASNSHINNPSVQIAAFGVFINLAADPVNAASIVEAGSVLCIVAAMKALSHDEKLMITSIQLCTVLASVESNARALCDAPVPALILNSMKTLAQSKDIWKAGLLCLAKTSVNIETAKAIADQGAIQTIITGMVNAQEEPMFLSDSLRVLQNLAIVESVATEISKMSNQLLVSLLEKHNTHQVFFRIIIGTMTHLSLFREAGTHLLYAGVVSGLIHSLTNYEEYPGLLAKILHVLSNLIMSIGMAAKKQMNDTKALETTRTLLTKHSDHNLLVQAAELFIQKMTETISDGVADIRDKVPKKVFNMLIAGAVFLHFGKGEIPRKKHLRMDDRLEKILYTDPKKKNVSVIPMRNIGDIIPGASTNELKKKPFGFHRQSVPDCSFAIFLSTTSRDSYSFESNNRDDASKWVSGLKLIKKLHIENS